MSVSYNLCVCAVLSVSFVSVSYMCVLSHLCLSHICVCPIYVCLICVSVSFVSVSFMWLSHTCVCPICVCVICVCLICVSLTDMYACLICVSHIIMCLSHLCLSHKCVCLINVAVSLTCLSHLCLSQRRPPASAHTASTGKQSRPLTAPSHRAPSEAGSSSSQFEGGRRMEALLQALYHEKDSGHFFRAFLKKSNNKVRGRCATGVLEFFIKKKRSCFITLYICITVQIQCSTVYEV